MTDANKAEQVAACNSAVDLPAVIELNVGGVFYTTTLSTLTRDCDSLLAEMFGNRSKSTSASLLRDSKGKYFIDRDGVLFRYTLDFLRNQKLVLPEQFHERERLLNEARHFRIKEMIFLLNNYKCPLQILKNTCQSDAAADSPADRAPASAAVADSTSPTTLPVVVPRSDGYITIGYRGTFAFGRDGLADVKFRKLSRILVCGRVALCREIFGETLNESRDPDRGATDRYSCRFFLKHSFLEQAFDMLQEAGFSCVASCGSGTASAGTDMKPGMDSEENRWNHYNEFVFCRP